MPDTKENALNKITREIENCRICRRGKIGRAIPGEGRADADVMFVGEAPGRKESESGRPFVGPSGKLLRKLITEAGLKDTDVYITSPVKYLPKYITPKLSDIQHGKRHLDAQIAIIGPKVVVLLGHVACQAVLGEKFAISKAHGKVIERDGVKYFISYHPAAPLHNPNVRKDLLKDFKRLKKLINGNKRAP